MAARQSKIKLAEKYDDNATMNKKCGHSLCRLSHPVTAIFHQCGTCGRMACYALGCTCSDYQARHPIRGAHGQPVSVRNNVGGIWQMTYSYDPEERARETPPETAGPCG